MQDLAGFDYFRTSVVFSGLDIYKVGGINSLPKPELTDLLCDEHLDGFMQKPFAVIQKAQVGSEFVLGNYYQI
jgi:hypothetical protein